MPFSHKNLKLFSSVASNKVPCQHFKFVRNRANNKLCLTVFRLVADLVRA